ncbi:class D beta-lactamase [Chitinibacter fontanus]|uniref:Beta-lactamase n=1 Tax=Chitinibacter fontanus TaxID=1737446 RepID=A0A7D5VAM4_9NEIS|nr:class D beta-lactamase [Chitinibacter fontanus]QLI81720.1 class D beta-lactamase [Chitinibacter fontanus]
MLRLFTLLFCLLSTMAHAVELETSPAMAKAFGERTGTFVLYDISQQRWIGHNPERAAQRFSPASTFKIPNSLIGLETGAVSSVDEVFYHHDGQPKYLKSWEHDMGLREAIKVSNLPAYQQLARKVGAVEMQRQLSRLQYGNANIGNAVDQFWINGSLQISAIEQSQFLAKLAQGKLPFSAKGQAAVREISELERGKDWVLYGKTGWTGSKPPSIGWFVGWVEQGGKIYSFALNMDVPDAKDLPLRLEIAKANLRLYGLLK